jgi:hypothetical protein
MDAGSSRACCAQAASAGACARFLVLRALHRAQADAFIFFLQLFL